MSQRLPAVHADNVQDKAAAERFSKIADDMFGEPGSSPFILKRPSDHALVGPFPFFFEQHEAGEHILGIFGKIGKIPNFPAEAREVVILTVGAHYKSAYELYAHTNVATKKVGMSKEVVEAIARGEKPDGLSEQNSVAYDASLYLASKSGALPQELWDKCIKASGKDGTVALVHYVGAYAYTCIALNAMDAQIPSEKD